MKMEELKELSVDELRAKLAEFTNQRFRLRFDSATQVVANPIQLRTLRRDIARIHTILRERELAEGAQA